MESNRRFLHFYDKEEYEEIVPESDEKKAKPFPLFQKPYNEANPLVDLIPPEKFEIGKKSFIDVINQRISRRNYTDEALSLEELSYLLWCTQGVKRTFKDKAGVLRTVPSAGAKSPFETYLVINRVEGIKPGLYRYISFSHKLLFIKEIKDAERKIGELAYDQMFVGKGAVIFCWVAIPYRTEWRYTILAHKFIAVDLGHVCENLYLACESIDLGTVAIGYYEQKKFDTLLELDGENEIVVLIAPVGKRSVPK
ncbi:MAG: SagB/ThcOx family dehydrogenase [Promethearchaeota archaeon]|jgi:SagB-type dehydrogenase family enzyme